MNKTRKVRKIFEYSAVDIVEKEKKEFYEQVLVLVLNCRSQTPDNLAASRTDEVRQIVTNRVRSDLACGVFPSRCDAEIVV